MKREFTATVYIFHEGRVLLLWHKKHNIWTAPGGHVEPNELPSETAHREAMEEAGVKIELIRQENLWMEFPLSKSIERPYLMCVEEIPAFGEAPPHQHIDCIYVAKLLSQAAALEAHLMRWFTQEEVQALQPDNEIFPDSQKTIDHLFQSVMVCS
jgi:ADP-ribose pyrophosphatase YjhB (NUDIX family)